MKLFVTGLLLINCLIGCKDESQQMNEKNAHEQVSYEKFIMEAPVRKKQASCPVIETEQWTATLLPSKQVSEESKGSRYTLALTGEVTLPTPGYTAVWSQGATDKMNPPSIRLHLSFSKPEQMVIQVLSPKKVKHSIDTPISSFRSVMVFCGNKLLTEIKNVSAE